MGGYLVCQHVAVSGWRAQAMLPPGYVLGATYPTPSPTYMYRPGGTGVLAQHPPIHAIFLTLRGRFIASPGRFCIAEAPATEWPFDDAPVPWILLEGYRNPKGTVLDFPGGDSQDEEDSPGEGSGAAPLTVPKTIGGTAQDDANDEDDKGFETVGDDEEVHGNQVLVSIPVGKVSKPEHSGSDRKGKMFESKEDDDPKVQEQIKAVLASSGPLGDLQLSESEDESKSDSPGDDDDEGNPNETKQYYKDQEGEAGKDSGLRPDSSTVATDPSAMPGNPRNPGGSNPGDPAKDAQPTKPIPSKGKGPNSDSSSKAPASKSGTTTRPSAVAQGVQERAQSTLFGVAALVQATGTEEDTVRCLENYTSLLAGLQDLVITMANGYEAATEDIRALVASTLDKATQRDHAFIAGASQALANWMEKYQQAMSQGENQSLHDQLAHWDQVRKAGITLSQKITSLTTDYEPGTASSEVFQASTLDKATQRDRAFIAGASQALANWMEKYQQAMSQGENQSLHDQLAHWDQVRKAGITLSQKITSLTTDYEPGTASSEVFQASTLDKATQRDHAFIAGASQALANWMEKYQQAMSQGENQSLHDQLARWDQVRKAGITLSQKITSLTTDYEPGTASSEVFQALLPDCFHRIQAQTEATFHELHATLPTLLCRFVAPDQAGQMLSAIFTCMCNYKKLRSAGWPWPRPWSWSTPFPTPTGSSNLCGRVYAGSFPV